MTDLHPKVRELITEGGHMEAFEKGELTLIRPILPTKTMDVDGFDAIGINDNGAIYAFKEADPSQPPPQNPVLMNSQKWELMKDRKELTIDILQNQGVLTRNEQQGGDTK